MHYLRTSHCSLLLIPVQFASIKIACNHVMYNVHCINFVFIGLFLYLKYECFLHCNLSAAWTGLPLFL